VSIDRQQGFVLWFTGLSGAGKTTLAKALELELKQLGLRIERLDGDIVRESLCRDLGFSKDDRDMNIERNTFVAKLLSRNGVGVLASFISPYRATRDKVRSQVTNFVEVYVSVSLDEVIKRDVKGLYKKALAGEIPNFTGVSDPYEPPINPEIEVQTDKETVQQSMAKILVRLEEMELISSSVVV
jgi:adenylyl-sulfate kinase